MDRSITSEEAGERFSDLLRDVAEGESFVVIDGGKPVARISPPVATFTSEELKAQAAEVRRLAAKLDKRPFRVIGPWTREDAYD